MAGPRHEAHQRRPTIEDGIAVPILWAVMDRAGNSAGHAVSVSRTPTSFKASPPSHQRNAKTISLSPAMTVNIRKFL